VIVKPSDRCFSLHENGFTLMELLVVLVIVGLVAAFVVPQVTAPMGGLQLKTASKTIVSAMRYARSQAVSQQQGRVVIFDFEMRKMMVFKGSDLPPEYRPDDLPLEKAEMIHELPGKVRIEKAVSPAEIITGGLFQVAFFPNGSSTGGEIFITSGENQGFCIKIDFITGLTSLEVADE
jgi:prepilin-type N-terminal cleavage/methylation domain-containing protein